MADLAGIAPRRSRLGYMLFGSMLATVIIFGFVWRNALFGQRFDSVIWKDAASQTEPKRIGMIDNLLWRYDLIGMPRHEIDHLLGAPDHTSYFSAYDYVYWLGPERGFISIDSEWLVLRFTNDTVTEAAVLTD